MTFNVGSLQPFELVGQRDLGNIFLQSLTQLYQPIIGPVSVSLYITMMSLPKPVNVDHRVALRHNIFLNKMKMGIDSFNKARVRLEAVGLLRSYRDKQFNSDPIHQTIQYHLKLPVLPEDFFQDPLLSTALLKQLGEEDYQNIYEQFQVNEIDEHRYVEETSVFQKVLYPLEVPEENKQPMTSKEEFVPSPGFDYNRFLNYLLSEGINHTILTQQLKRQVYAIYDVYGNSETELANFVFSATDKTDGTLDLDFLKQIAEKHNKKKESSWQTPSNLPSQEEQRMGENRTSQMFTPEELKTRREQIKVQFPNLLEEDIQLVLSCEQMPSNMFLSKTKEAKKTFATDSEQFYIKDLSQKSRLNEHVINFLIYYLLIINHRPNLFKGELERTASEWEQEDLTNVPKAMEYIRSLRKKKEIQNKQWNNKNQNRRRGKSQYKEIIPSWMQKNSQASEQHNIEATESKNVQENEAELRRRLNELIGGEGES
ncbi:DnaD domain protein [Aerococcaceae bacterium WGS1372]